MFPVCRCNNRCINQMYYMYIIFLLVKHVFILQTSLGDVCWQNVTNLNIIIIWPHILYVYVDAVVYYILV